MARSPELRGKAGAPGFPAPQLCPTLHTQAPTWLLVGIHRPAWLAALGLRLQENHEVCCCASVPLQGPSPGTCLSGEAIMGCSAVLLAVALATLLAPEAGVPIRRPGFQNKLFLVSFDGFHWNYDQDVHTPNLDATVRDRVKAQYMTPAFVTMTSLCHFTLVTGRYIENHGVVHNMYYNTTSKVKLPYHATLGVQRWWDDGSVPIWITAQRRGLKTGSFFYPGGNVTYQGMAMMLSREESVLHNYKDEEERRANIDTVLKWFTEEGLHLVTLYFGDPDSTGHRYGPESQERKERVRQVDRTVGYLRASIRHSGLQSSLNLIITSDHGMSTVNKIAGDLVELHKFPNFTFKDIEFELLDYGPNGMLLPKEGVLEVYKVLKDAHPKLHVYKKESFPKSLHYTNNRRVTPLLMYSDPGYVIHGVRCLRNARLRGRAAGSLSISIKSTPYF
ncbi:ectonucleotide pyrophosphatase/phosphodiesterase family member 7 [Diceros bicornis minor]|uniref:ectonucleotide pyrophosphatase/phosphodiesterase family member 7 n=1 Tax=Diceros bicornis minor TaxID=77932 RepID=UPI0026EAD0F5|nr:ectonucleotide pyrophosphatase/phosphodiesterase family member 7 [Diceros bicornis minor]